MSQLFGKQSFNKGIRNNIKNGWQTSKYVQKFFLKTSILCVCEWGGRYRGKSFRWFSFQFNVKRKTGQESIIHLVLTTHWPKWLLNEKKIGLEDKCVVVCESVSKSPGGKYEMFPDITMSSLDKRRHPAAILWLKHSRQASTFLTVGPKVGYGSIPLTSNQLWKL